MNKKTSTSKIKIQKENRLYLNLKRVYFDRILSGKKTKEYRDRTRYYWTRIGSRVSKLKYIWFINGMKKGSDHMLVKFEGLTNDDDKSNTQYVLKLGRIISTDKNEIHSMMIE